jgi:hypothetical protein
VDSSDARDSRQGGANLRRQEAVVRSGSQRPTRGVRCDADRERTSSGCAKRRPSVRSPSRKHLRGLELPEVRQ